MLTKSNGFLYHDVGTFRHTKVFHDKKYNKKTIYLPVNSILIFQGLFWNLAFLQVLGANTGTWGHRQAQGRNWAALNAHHWSRAAWPLDFPALDRACSQVTSLPTIGCQTTYLEKSQNQFKEFHYVVFSQKYDVVESFCFWSLFFGLRDHSVAWRPLINHWRPVSYRVLVHVIIFTSFHELKNICIIKD